MFKKNFLRILIIVAMFFSSITNISANSVVVSGLKGTYNWLPEEKKQFSPLHGVVMAHNGELKKIYGQEGSIGDIVRLLFNLKDNKMRATVQPSNAASVLNDKLLHHLLMHLETDKPFVELKDKPTASKIKELNEFGRKWKDIYIGKGTELNNKNYGDKNFKQSANKLMKALDTALENPENKNIIRNLFLSFVYLKSKTNSDLKLFLSLFLTDKEKADTEMNMNNIFNKKNAEEIITELNNPQYAKPNNIEEIAYALIISDLATFDFLNISSVDGASYQGKYFPNCVEVTVHTIINTLLYDPEENCLSLNQLPQTVFPNPKLKVFIEKYKDPTSWSTQKKFMTNDWTDIVSGINGIAYVHENYELQSNNNNVIALFTHLLGLQPISSFAALGEKLSSPSKAITFTKIDDTNTELAVTIKHESNPLTLNLDITLKSDHGTCSFKKNYDFNLTLDLYKKVMNISKQVQIPLINIIDVNKPINNGATSFLNEALEKKDKDSITLMLKNGAIPNNSSLNKALKINDKDLVTLMLKSGAIPNKYSLILAINTKDKELVTLILKNGTIADKICLNEAIKTKNKDLVVLILENGVIPDKNSLNEALSIENNNDIVTLILQKGVQLDIGSLYQAIHKKNKDIVALILQKGIQPNIDCLNDAIYTKDKDIIKLILTKGVKPNEESLNKAIKTKDKELIKLMLTNGAQPNYNSLKGAIKTKNPEIIALIEEALKKN